MTRRQRLEAKIEKREEWAAGRRAKASAIRQYTDRYRGDVAFNTQPGHIPERARVIRAIDRAHDHVSMADHHDSKAAGLAAQLDKSVFSDDDNAIEALEARIAENEAERDRMKLVNRLHSKGDAAGLAAIGIDLDRLKVRLAEAGPYWGSKPRLPYELTNLGARIRADRERIKAIKARHQRTAQAEAAPDGVAIEGGEWVRITFAEKPEREILEALKAAGFLWRRGSWIGQRVNIPACVTA
jgi:hypothetical protein